MDGLDIKDLQGNNINDFVKNYRDSLDRSYAANVSQLEQQRRNDEASIMAQANARGMMYSNFPERSKMQYEAQTYLPNRQKLFTTYQTGLDKLRSNAVNVYNNIKSIEDAISDLNSAGNGGGNGGTGGRYAYGKVTSNASGGSDFFDNNGNKIRFATWAKNNGATNDDQVLLMARAALNQNEYNALKRIYDAQQNTKRPHLNTYTGNDRQEVYWPTLSGGDRALMEALGLSFGS